MKYQNPTQTEAWRALSTEFIDIENEHISTFFAADPERFKKFSKKFGDLFIDYSKNRLSDATLPLLIELAHECELKAAIEAMFNGEKINHTEKRAVLHIA